MQPPLERHVVVGDALVEGGICGWRGRRGLAGSGGRAGGVTRHGHMLLVCAAVPTTAPRGDTGLVACLGDLVVFRRIRFPCDAREAGVPGFRRADDPDRLAAIAPLSGLVRLKRFSKPRAYSFAFSPGLLFRNRRT